MSVDVMRTTSPPAVVVWFHGMFGSSDQTRKVLLAFKIRGQLPWVRWCMPDAEVGPVSMFQTRWVSRWFDMPRQPVEYGLKHDGLNDAIHRVNALLKKIVANGVPPHRVILGGFSQGAALALHAGLSSDVRVGGIISIAGWLCASTLETARQPEVPILMSHGSEDKMVPIGVAKQSVDRLKAMGCSNLSFIIFNGLNHALIEQQWDEIVEFLSSAVPQADESCERQEGCLVAGNDSFVRSPKSLGAVDGLEFLGQRASTGSLQEFAPAKVIWLHNANGIGASWEKSVQASGLLKSMPWVHWSFPDAPAQLAADRSNSPRSWFNMPHGRVLEGVECEGLDEAVSYIHRLLEETIAEGIPARRIVLAGVSQGATLALTAGLTFRGRRRLAGICALSGWVPPNLPRSIEQPETLVCISHGSKDAVVPIELARNGLRSLEAAGCSSAYIVCYSGIGHEFVVQQWKDVSELILSAVPARDLASLWT